MKIREFLYSDEILTVGNYILEKNDVISLQMKGVTDTSLTDKYTVFIKGVLAILNGADEILMERHAGDTIDSGAITGPEGIYYMEPLIAPVEFFNVIKKDNTRVQRTEHRKSSTEIIDVQSPCHLFVAIGTVTSSTLGQLIGPVCVKLDNSDQLTVVEQCLVVEMR